VKVTVSAVLPVDIDTAWEMLHSPSVFGAVSSPFTVFREDPSAPLPARFTPDTNYTVRVYAGGIIPMGTQIIRLEDTVASPDHRHTTDVGHGASGMLSLLKNWRHQMELKKISNGETQFNDQLSVNASWQTPLLWVALNVFWRWRAMRLRQIARKQS
jgi:hypothetical protein